MKMEAEKIVNKFNQLYDLSVGLGFCSRDVEFEETLRDMKYKFEDLLDADRKSESSHGSSA